MEYNNFDKNLIILLNIFKDRPNHLIQFLIENDAFKEAFKKKVNNSNKLNSLKDFDSNKMDFNDFTEMNMFFSELMDGEKTKISVEKEMNNKLFKLLYEEKYETAAKLRDYMKKNNLKIKL